MSGNIDNLKPQPFVNGHDPRRNLNGRPKGSRNRSTILREILGTPQKLKNKITRKDETLELEKHIDLSIVRKAYDGDVSAWNSIKDAVYGKVPNQLTGADEQPLFEPDLPELFDIFLEVQARGLDKETFLALASGEIEFVDADECEVIDCVEIIEESTE